LVRLEPASLLLLAAQIAVLTYYIGVLIYMLPIPVRGLKRWAPILIQDSIWAVILVLAFSSILYLSDVIASWSGYTLNDVITYVRARMSALLIFDLIYRAIYASISISMSSMGRFVSFLFLPLTLNLYAIIVSLAIIAIIASIIAAAKATLVALGTVLMALPFRIGRNAGASLIAFSIVSNAMLPFLPHWLSFLYQNMFQGYSSSMMVPEKPSSYSLTFYNLWGTVYDASKNTPRGGILKFHNIQLNITYLLKLKPDGSYYIIPPNSLPNGTYDIRFEAMGIKSDTIYRINIPNDLKATYELDEAPYRLNIILKDIVYIRPDIVIKVIDCDNIRLIENNVDRSIIECTPVSTHFVKIVISSPRDCSVRVKTEGGDIYSRSFKQAQWRGITVSLYGFGVYGGIGYPIRVIVEKSGACSIEWNQVVVSSIISGTSRNESYPFDTFAYLIMYMVLLPSAIFAYLTIMGLISTSFARLLGATHARVMLDF
jgi:hypothetical protein